ncbi:hypothetical protein PybrP1_008014 [[Pythium] brassicae (nom. inval.)]|nr:hypothetical protein PybrP1_008014 [[Pythium] brassicae (nom. inval.)]
MSSSRRGTATDAQETSRESFEKLFASALDPQTCDHHQRHLALAKNVLFQNELGWKLSELSAVNDFVLLLRDKVLDGLEQFLGPLLAAVALCSKPFVRLKANEEISNPSLLHGILPTLAQLLSFELLDVQLAAAEALLQFATGACLTRSTNPQSNDAEANADDLRLSPRVFSLNLMEETGAAEAIVGVLYDLFPDDNDMRTRDAVPSPETVMIDSDRAPPTSLLLSDRLSSTGAVTQRSDVDVETDRYVSPTTPALPGGTVAQLNESRTAAVLFPIMEIVCELSGHQRCAEVLVLSGALHFVVFVLESVTDPQDELLPLGIVVLWNVLELCHAKMAALRKCASRRELLEHFRLRNAAYFLSNEFTLQALLHVFELLLARGYRKQDKEMRNECLMVLHLLARRRRSLDCFYATGLTASLLSYATAAETHKKKPGKKQAAKKANGGGGRSRPLVPRTTASAAAAADDEDPAMPSSARAVAINADHHHYATSCDEDFEFKQMLWYVIAEVTCDHDANRSELVQFRFTEVLLLYATAGWTDSDGAAPHHTPAQRQALQTTALSVLNHIAPSMLEHVYEVNGHQLLLEFLQRSVWQSDETLAAAWLLMAQLAPAMPVWQDALGAIGAVEAAVAAFGAPPSRHTFRIRRHALMACASMCRDHEANRQRFRLAHGVHVVSQHLAFDPSHAVLEEHIVVATLDAVRSCVVGDPESERAFIEDDGVVKLLAVLARAPLKAVKNQVLAALAEVCVNPAATPSFVTWRSDQRETNNATATQLLMRLYADEDAAEELRSKTAAACGDAEIVALDASRHSAFHAVASCRNPLLVPTKLAEGDVAEPDAGSSARPQSPAFARLMAALRAAQTADSVDWRARRGRRRSLLELEAAERHPDVNLKAKVYVLLANVSFACDASTDALTANEHALLEVAKEYPTFQVGEMWQNVHLALHAEGVRPVYADALHIRRHIEHAYNATVATKLAQTELLAGRGARAAAAQDAFLQRILLQKDQDEQAEAFHRASRRQNSTLTLHLDAKRTRLAFLRRQDPTAFAAYESASVGPAQIRDPAPASDCSDLNSLEQKEAELRGRLGTLAPCK